MAGAKGAASCMASCGRSLYAHPRWASSDGHDGHATLYASHATAYAAALVTLPGMAGSHTSGGLDAAGVVWRMGTPPPARGKCPPSWW